MKLPDALLRLLYPPQCVVCGEPLPRDRMICPSCERYLNHPADKKRCPVCFLPTDRCGCGKRLYYEQVAAPFLRDTPARYAVDRMKFRYRLDLVRPLAYFMKAALDERGMTDKADLITFIPMDRKQQKRKGYNQAEELAGELSKQTGLPCLPLLEKYLRTAPQHESPSRLCRSGNLLGAYEPIRENIPVFAGKSVLLTDDIITTGATFNEAAKTLLIFGADKVYGAAAMMTPKEKTVKQPSGAAVR